jgi:hypothetical protein
MVRKREVGRSDRGRRPSAVPSAYPLASLAPALSSPSPVSFVLSTTCTYLKSAMRVMVQKMRLVAPRMPLRACSGGSAFKSTEEKIWEKTKMQEVPMSPCVHAEEHQVPGHH